jgi:two-component system response regulator FixJ
MPDMHTPPASAAPWVCLVEDDSSVRTALRRLLSSAGYHVDAYASPFDCLEHRGYRDSWGCLILDMSMPGMTGFELQQKLRECGCAPPLVFITGQDRAAARSQAMRAGAIGYLRKPFDGDELMLIVGQALRKSATHRR